MKSMKKRLFILFVFFLPFTSSAWAEYGPRNWLHSSTGALYQEVASELEVIINEAERQQIPGDLLVDKLKEGAAKRVTGTQLVQALRTEVDRLITATTLLKKPGRRVSGDRQSLLRTTSLLLQGGIPVDTIDAVLEYASLIDKSSNRAINALSTALRVIAIAQAPADLLRPLSECLVRSTLQDPQFSQLQSFTVRARGKQIQGEPLIKLIIGSLDSGNGLAYLDREIERRSQRP
ncbi:hypothetical protein [Treponema sp. J25]|jgi:hypothetical protein|uniref:hypothetical protein n=1 Tax=Treponema sp. J25 TaxID=2094121 RepID=UPI001046B2D8|nr:hypothetical protein [Treponema sp. J25]TCW61438.1 hypothetical protein C5O22_06350 [Treponema sp. J25]